jgi:hypothetical protein
MNTRPLESWIARQSNGWYSHVLESPEGRYAGWAAPENTTTSVGSYSTVAIAKAAAIADLFEKAQHLCSDQCERWQRLDSAG